MTGKVTIRNIVMDVSGCLDMDNNMDKTLTHVVFGQQLGKNSQHF